MYIGLHRSDKKQYTIVSGNGTWELFGGPKYIYSYLKGLKVYIFILCIYLMDFVAILIAKYNFDDYL